MSRTQGHSTADRNMSVKICSNTIGNLSRDLPVCSAMPHSKAAPCETEGHLINGDLHSCMHVTSVILFLYLSAERITLICCSRMLTCFSLFNLQIFYVFSIKLLQSHVYYILVGHFYMYDVRYWVVFIHFNIYTVFVWVM